MGKHENNEGGQSPKKRYNFRKKTYQNRKKNYKVNPPHSDTDSDSDWLPEKKKKDDSEEESCEYLTDDASTDDECIETKVDNKEENVEEDEMNTRELQRFIQKIFPSKSGQERLQQLEKLDEMVEKQKKNKNSKNSHTNASRSRQKTTKRKKKKKVVKKKKNKKKACDELKNEHQHLEDELMREEEEIDNEELEEMMRMQNMKFNIIFTVGGGEGFYEEEESEESSDEEDNQSKEKFKKGEKISIKLKDWDQFYMGTIKTVRQNGNYDVILDDESYDVQRDIRPKFLKSISKEEIYTTLIQEMEELSKMRSYKGKKAMMRHLDKLSQASIKKTEKEQKERDKKEQIKNVGKLRKLLRDKNVMNDFKYFGKMAVDSQKCILHKLKEVNDYYSIEKPYRISLLESNIPIAFKSQALKKINVLSYMDPGSGEYYKIKQWVDTFMSIPFGKHQSLPIQLSDGKEKCGQFMENAKKILDECVYGLEDAKMQILQYIGQWISNPNTTGTAIAIKGPPGTGKTTLIKEGISKILSRPFAFLALGGATDSSFLEGHSP